MAVPVTGDRGQAVILAARRGQPPPVARAHQCLIQLAFDHGLDKAAHPIAHPSFDRIEPIVEKIHSCFANRLRGIRLRDNVLHGVVSYLTLQRSDDSRFEHPGDYATLNSNQLRDGTACQSCAIKAHCTTGKERRITRWEHEHVLEAVQRRLDEHPEKMRQRRETVEHPFGTIKARMGATHFLMKTLPKVATEMALHVLAYNLTRVMNIMGIQPLVAVMRA